MRALTTTLLCLLVLAAGAAAAAGSQTELTVDTPLALWQGAAYAVATVPAGVMCTPITCDTFSFRVTLDPEMPPPYPPLSATISWASADDDFDLALYDGWGFLVVESASRFSNAEAVYVPEIKAGDYTLVVSPALVTNSDYAGEVGLVVAER